MKETEKDIYVVVCERDTYEPSSDGRPIVFEQYIDNEYGTLIHAIDFIKKLGSNYGKKRIAKLVFIQDGDK